MEDDTMYMPHNEFERRLRTECGIKAFREYREQLHKDQQKEREMMEKGEYITVKEV